MTMTHFLSAIATENVSTQAFILLLYPRLIDILGMLLSKDTLYKDVIIASLLECILDGDKVIDSKTKIVLEIMGSNPNAP